MKNTYLRSLYFCFFLVPFVAVGQIVDLRQAPYNMTAADTVTLDKRFATFNDAAASPALKAFCGWLTYVGAAATWNQWRLHEAYPRNAVWANDDYVGVTYYQNGLGSKAGIIFPAGEYWMSHYIIKVQGGIWCAGSGGFYDANNGAAGGTTFILDRKRWKGDPGDNSGIKCCFKDNFWGDLGNSGYMEGSGLYACKILGGAGDFYDPAVHESGILCWTAGEQYNIEDVHIYSFNDYGVELQGTRHATFSATRLSVFLCNKAGIGIIAGGHLEMYLGSFDDNPAAYEAIPDAQGKTGNGTYINCFGTKFETGKTDARPRSKAQLLLKGKGWIKFNSYGCSYSCVNSKPPYLFEIETTQNVSKINMYGTDWFDTPGYLVHDQTRNEIIGMDSDPRASFTTSNITDFKWRSDGWYEAPGCSLKVITAVSDTRLAPLQRVYDAAANSSMFVGSWNLAAGTPAYSYTAAMAGEPGAPTVPTTPTCKITYTVTSTCPSTGKWMTRTATLSPANCATVPADSLSRTCTTTPPPSGGAKWTSAGSWTGTLTMTANTCFPQPPTTMNVPGVTVVELKQFKPTALTWGRVLGEGGTTGGLQISPQGEWYWRGAKIQNAPKVTANVAADYTITLPSAGTITAVFQTSCGQGGAQVGTCGTMTLK